MLQQSLINSKVEQFMLQHERRTHIIKVLVGSILGMYKETLYACYVSICRPVVNYTASVWLLGHIDERLYTNIYWLKSLHEETVVLLDIMVKLFLLQCHRRSLPSLNIILLESCFLNVMFLRRGHTEVCSTI